MDWKRAWLSVCKLFLTRVPVTHLGWRSPSPKHCTHLFTEMDAGKSYKLTISRCGKISVENSWSGSWTGSAPGAQILGSEGLDPLKVCRRGQCMFWLPHPLKCRILSFKPLLDNCESFTLSRMKDMRQNWKVKLIFRGPLQAVRNRNCWVFGNHWRSV